MRTIKHILIIALVVMLAANIATLIYQGTTDTTDPPKINCPPGVLEVAPSVSEAELLADITAYDNQDGDLTSYVMVGGVSKLISEDTAKVTYLVFDSDDNMASIERKIRYNGYHKPHFEVNEALLYSRSEEVDLLSRLSATCAIDGDISDLIRVSTLAATEDSDISGVLVYDVTVQVTNSKGDTASISLPVLRVSDPMLPEVKLNKYLEYIDVGAAFDPQQYLVSAGGAGNLEDVKIQNWVDTSAPGVYRVYYTYTDGYGTGTAILTVSVQ